jgi:transcription-repair coupling factor (superfamily II helicase)
MFKAAQRVQQRQSEEAIEIRQSDEKLAEALLVKQVVEHTTSFLDLFFNPNKFISKQLEKQNRAVEPTAKLPSDASKGTDALAQNDFEASSANSQESSAGKELRQKLESFCFYELLSVSQTASSDEIGRAYLDKLKNLRARFQAKKDLQEWQLNELVRALNRASEVLGDSSTRKKYDLSLLGIHEFEKYPVEKSAAMAGKKQEDTGGSVVALGLSQLFVIGGLISPPELEKATAGGHTLNDRRLIEFMVDTELATFDEISAVILAQALIAKGRLTMSQFKLGMKEMRANSIRFVDTLVAEGWLSAEDLPSTR